MGKGSRRRREDTKKISDNWDKIKWPEKEWVENIIKQARESKIPIFIKNNVGWKKKIQELPKVDYMKGGV